MRIWTVTLITALSFCAAGAALSTEANAQIRIVLKAGESVELQSVYYISNCRSILIGAPQVEILEGPPQVTLSIKEGMVLPRRQECANRVLGGTLIVTAKDILEPTESKITFRLTYKTKSGDRQRGHVYLLSLFP